MITNAVNGSNNGVCGDSDAHINELDEELRKCKHRVAELEVSGLCCLKRVHSQNLRLWTVPLVADADTLFNMVHES